MKKLIALIIVLALVLTIAVIPKNKKDHYHTVVFYTYRNDPTIIETIRVSSNGRINKPVDPVRASAIFEGWYLNIDGSGEEFDFNQKITKSITLYAKWEIFIYEIIYDLNGGEWPSEEIRDEYSFEVNVNDPIVYFPSTQSTRKAPKHESFGRFTGWYIISQSDYNKLSEEERKDYSIVTKIESKKDLEAMFDEETRTLTLYAHYRNYVEEPEGNEGD